MPPAGSSKKTATTSHDNRRSSGRQIRTSISRPTNYYARPFGSVSNDDAPEEPPGFFPAIQFFTDSVAALPKEIMRHFTLLKEVEAKVYGPTEEMGRIAARISTLPPAPRKNHRAIPQALLNFSASSGFSSANASMVNGSVPTSVPPSVAEAAEIVQADPQIELRRRKEFHGLKMAIGQVLANLDEKNVCLSDANRTLQRQIARMESVLPHVEAEISEEARLGSLTHWAYADNRKKAQQPERSRGVAATSNLAAAAAAIHEGDIAAARNETRKETKKGRVPNMDSELEERGIKKPSHRARKPDEVKVQPVVAQPVKKRKAEKPAGAGMERTTSSTGRNGKTQASAPRSSSLSEPVKKKTKPSIPPLVKKRAANGVSPAQSPKIAGSPTLSAFPAQGDSNLQRPASRMRHTNSTLQHSTLANAAEDTPQDRKDGKQANGRMIDMPSPHTTTNGDVTMSNTEEDPGHAEAEEHMRNTEASTSGPSGARPAQNRIADIESVPMARTRSTGARDSNSHVRKNSAQRERDSRHSRHGSSQHILKQIASFNRSPTMGRRELNGTEDDSSASEEKPLDKSGREVRALRRTESRVRSPDPDDELQDELDDQPDADVEVENELEESSEPKYCYCGRESYGTMIGCENEDCEREWFHLGCTNLRAVPAANVQWYCDDCDPNKGMKRTKSGGRH